MTASTILLNAASGTAGDPLFVENVFSTFVYDGTNDNNHSINNGIDLSGEGGLVWIKSRDVSRNHALYDTERGVNKYLSSNTNSAQTDLSSSNDQGVKAFNSNGFTMDDDALVNANDPGFVSWTFRKAPNFFDIQTWSGDNSTNRSISHNINGTVGAIFVKRTNGTDSWYCYHRGIGETKTVFLESSLQAYTRPDWGDTAPTSSAFTVNGITNSNGYDYVAYIFGHNNSDGGYGDSADQDIIKCGSYTGNSAGDPNTDQALTFGFEPSFIMIKKSSGTGNWLVMDNMRAVTIDGNPDDSLAWNTSAEEQTDEIGHFTSTGYTLTGANANYNGDTYIYMAIRRGPMATPTAASDVFSVKLSDTNTDTSRPAYISNFPVDFAIYANPAAGGFRFTGTRMTGAKYLETNANSAEASASTWTFDWMDGWRDNFSATGYPSWMWRRAPGYFDVVAYTGNATAGRTVNHNLGVVPEMIWIKGRTAYGWVVYHKAIGNSKIINLNDDYYAYTQANFNNTDPTSSVFTLGSIAGTNANNATFIAYLFATVAGVSKVGSVTHSGTTNVDCGFTSGSSFVLLKRTDATGWPYSGGGWYVWDSARGIVAGNDPYILLDDTAAEVTNTDLIDPLSSGFTITDDFTDGTYLFYAIAAIS